MDFAVNWHLQHQTILEHQLQKKKGYVILWETLDKGYELTGGQKRNFPSKGGYLHTAVVTHVKVWARLNGYKVDIEWVLASNKAVDLVLRNAAETVFVEVGISPPYSKEITGMIKDFSTELMPDRLIMACKDGKMKRGIEKLILAEPVLKNFSDRIEVCLAGDFVAAN